MKLPDLEKMNKDELETLIKAAQKALKTVDARKRKAALDAAKAAAIEHGFDLSELTGAGTAKKSRRPQNPPKYRNPDNPDDTWSGLGRKPEWIKAKEAAGVPLDELTI